MTAEGEKPQHIDNRSKLEILNDIERETEALLSEFTRSLDLANQQADEHGLEVTDENLDVVVGTMSAGDIVDRLAELDLLAASLSEGENGEQSVNTQAEINQNKNE